MGGSLNPDLGRGVETLGEMEGTRKVGPGRVPKRKGLLTFRQRGTYAHPIRTEEN